jgi:hypothetical protein
VLDKFGENILDKIMKAMDLDSKIKLTFLFYLLKKRDVKISPFSSSDVSDSSNITELAFHV